MKIIYISDVDISRPTGPGVNEREFVHSLMVESLKRGDLGRAVIPRPGRDVEEAGGNVLHYRGLGWMRPSLLRGLVLPVRILALLWREGLLRGDVDLFVVRLSRDLLLLPLLLGWGGRRYTIKTLGNLYGFVGGKRGIRERVGLRLTRKILGRVLRGAVSVDVCTPQYLEKYREAYLLENLLVVENSVNVERFTIMDRGGSRAREGLGGFRKIVGYCGGSPSERGGGHLIRISARLAEEFPGCGILIIGDDEEIPLLKAAVEGSGLAGRVIFRGEVDYTETPSLINCMDVGVALDSEARLKSIGNSSQKIKQYLACGIPVVCAEGTNMEVIEHGLGTGIDAGDLDALYDAVAFWFGKAVGEDDGERVKRRRFVEENFSTGVAFEKRYEAWSESSIVPGKGFS